MRLLVTRPEPECSTTAETLRSFGHEVIAAPLLTVHFTPVAVADDPSAILVTSQNGVRALAAWPAHRRWLARPVFAVGPATARAMRALGFSNVAAGGGDADALAALVADRFGKGDGPILYPAARDRAGALPDALVTRGYDVRTVEAYRAEPVAALPDAARAALGAGAVDGVLLYSRRTAQTFLALAESAGVSGSLSRPAYYVISERVAELTRPTGGVVHVAATPDEDSLLAAIPKAG